MYSVSNLVFETVFRVVGDGGKGWRLIVSQCRGQELEVKVRLLRISNRGFSLMKC